MRLAHAPIAAALALGAACAGAPARSPESPASPGRPDSSRPAVAEKTEARPAGPGAGAAARAPDEPLSPRAQRLFEEAVASVEEQRKLKVPTDWALLERKWRNVLDAADIAEAHYNLGVALEKQGKLSDARDAYRRAVEAKPGFRQAAVNLAVLDEKEGDARSAAATYGRIAVEYPEDAVSRERLAAIYLAAGQLEEAWSFAREALLRDPGALGAQKVMIRVSLQKGNLDLAKLLSLRAQKLDERDAELAFLGGQIAARQGDDAAATVQWRKALSLDPSYAPARHGLLDAAIRSEAWGQVAEQARAILKEDPKNASVTLALGIAQRHLGQADDALASYEKAEQLAGERLPEVHLARGVLLMKVKSECEPAIQEFKAYARGVGPVLAGDATVFKLQRECEQIVEENRKALEAARRIQEDAAKKASPSGSTGGQGGGALPTSAPSPR
jgi:tetratricopeptide (TPR) repeat protein